MSVLDHDLTRDQCIEAHETELLSGFPHCDPRLHVHLFTDDILSEHQARLIAIALDCCLSGEPVPTGFRETYARLFRDKYLMAAHSVAEREVDAGDVREAGTDWTWAISPERRAAA